MNNKNFYRTDKYMDAQYWLNKKQYPDKQMLLVIIKQKGRNWITVLYFATVLLMRH